MSSDNGMRSNLDRRKFLHAAGKSVAAGLLLLAFTVAMTFSLGIKALLDYFVLLRLRQQFFFRVAIPTGSRSMPGRALPIRPVY